MDGSAATASATCNLSDCRRWREYLETVSAVYSELQQERTAGWQSEALDWFYKRRQEQGEKGRKDSEKNRQDDTAATCATSFVNSDTAKLCDRYCEHAERILLRAAPSCFTVLPLTSQNPAAETEEKSLRTFLDIGSAPGGVSKFLVTKLHWRGVGVSLPVSRGGIASDASWLQSPETAGRYEFVEGNILENEWHESIKGRKFYFVNGGAVQDHGQRSAEIETNTAGTVSSGEAQQPVLPWFSFLVPQLSLAVKHVEEGGAMMLVFGVPQCASLSILLALLQPLVDGGIHILETMHLTKSPVYILLTGVRVRCNAETRAAWENILKLLTEGSRDYWLGETEEGMQLAKTGFAQHQKELEAVWGKTTAFLRRRRLQAERAKESSVNGRRAVKRGRNGLP